MAKDLENTSVPEQTNDTKDINNDISNGINNDTNNYITNGINQVKQSLTPEWVKPTLRERLKDRILLLDGATGTQVQKMGVAERNIDSLVLTRPEIIASIAEDYLKAGADIIETCTFNSQSISQADYNLTDKIRELNLQGARIARELADRYSTPEQPRYVVASVGPTNKMLSMSADVENPGLRQVTYDQMEQAYIEQMEALIEGGVDAMMIETAFDTLNVKAALTAAQKAMEKVGRKVELMISVTISDSSGRMLAGQTLEALLITVAHADVLSVGLNCSLGAKALLPHARTLSKNAPNLYISVHPNAGLPNQFGEYDDTPEIMTGQLQEFLQEGVVNIIGGCCGTTPEHIAHMRQLIDNNPSPVRKLKESSDSSALKLAGLEPLKSENTFVNVGERCNVAGSRKFLRLINEKKYDEALQIARKQVEDGAMVIDINMDDAMLDAPAEMTTFLNLLASDPVIAKAPIMIDSSRFEVIEAALKCIQGKPVVNSISLKEGQEKFLEKARKIRSYGAAVIVMAFDEQGQATTTERKIQIAQRAYDLLTQKAGYTASDIIFDPNVLTVATGMEEHADYALSFVEAAEWIHQNLPGTRVSGGLSNLSFSFRGNDYVRNAMHAVFLYRAIQQGLDMAIMNPSSSVTYEDIPAHLREAIEDVLFGSRSLEATERLIAMATQIKNRAKELSTQDAGSKQEQAELDRQRLSVEERLKKALLEGNPQYLQTDLEQALKTKTALEIISGPLMEGMNHVGKLFGEGKLFLPQVVKTARTMKAACQILEPYFHSEEDPQKQNANGHLLIATVKGDVHDIGKNIVSVVLGCNSYHVDDMGVMVPAEDIIRQAKENNVDIVCLSGLITPSLEEMCNVVTLMENEGMTIPVMVGGATTSELHTAVKIAPLYSGPVIHVRDAAQNPIIAQKLLNPETAQEYIEQNALRQAQLRQAHSQKRKGTNDETCDCAVSSTDSAEIKAHDTDINQPMKQESTAKPEKAEVPTPPFIGVEIHKPIMVRDLIPLIDWRYFFHTWKVGYQSQEAQQLREDALGIIGKIADDKDYAMRAITGFFYARKGKGSIELSTCGCHYATSIPTPKDSNGISLSDFQTDYIGAFAATVSERFIHNLEELKKESDMYLSMLWQTIGDRLAEATSEYLHRQLHHLCSWEGIRPAFGYPALPEQRDLHILAQLLKIDRIGIEVTENGAMYPQASVAGLYIPHPQARYIDARPRLD